VCVCVYLSMVILTRLDNIFEISVLKIRSRV